MSTIVLERDGGIAWLRMNRPEAHNAFDREMTALLASLVSEVADDRGVRAVILCGAGPSFSTGVDVKELARGGVTAEMLLDWHRMARRLGELPMPLIVALHGHCLGGGVMLTLAADYRLGADDLRIGLGAVRHGILPGSAPELLPAILGAAAARRLCLFGEYVGADEALRIGLIDRVVAPGELEAQARELAERACSFSQVAVRECKALMARAPSLDAEGYEQAYLEAQRLCLSDRGAPSGQHTVADPE